MVQTKNIEFLDFITEIARSSGLSVELSQDGNSYAAVFSDGTRLVFSSESCVARVYVKKPVEKDHRDCYNPGTGGVYG